MSRFMNCRKRAASRRTALIAVSVGCILLLGVVVGCGGDSGGGDSGDAPKGTLAVNGLYVGMPGDRALDACKKIVDGSKDLMVVDYREGIGPELAAALEAVGATVEISDKDLGTVTSGNCSVVLKKLPFMMGRCDRAFVSAVIAEAMGCMPVNAWKMMDDLPLTVAENISREEAEEIASKIKARKCQVEIV